MFSSKALVVLFLGLAGFAAGAQISAPAQQQTSTQTGSTSSPTAGVSTGAATVQTGGTKVHGTITDPDGELLPGAVITLTPAHGGAVKTKAGGDGTYTVSVSPGSYTVVVTMQGFASYSVLNFKVPAVPGLTLDAKLAIGEQNQVVNVEANTLTLSVDQDSNASATVLTGKDLDALSDDPDELSSELSALAGPSAGPNGGQIYVDGFTGGQLPPKSSIREIRINQNPFSAQFDRLGYGRVEVFTKPGTDKIHGSLQFNANPSQFNSASPLEAGVNQPAYHTFFTFGNISGPINKNASYSVGGSYRDIQDDSFTEASVLAPSAAVPVVSTPCPSGDTACVITQIEQSTHSPQSRFDIAPRIDLALGSKNVLTTRVQYVHNSLTNQGIGGLTLAQNGYNQTSESAELQVSDTQTFSTKLINETRFEYERDRTASTPLSTAPTVYVQGAFTSGGNSGQTTTDHSDHFEVQNYTSLQLKKNFIRFGGRLRTTREAQDAQGNTNGQFTYSSLTYSGTGTDNSYETGAPAEFLIAQLHTQKVAYTLADLGMYLETDWKPLPNLTVSYGFRYETQNNLNDHHDIAPRTSFAYGLGNSKAAPKTVIRGGFGMFYDRFGQGQVLALARQGQNTNVENVYTLGSDGQPIPAGCNPQDAASALPADCLAGVSASANTTYSVTPNLRTPYILQFAAGADQQVGKFGTLSVNYLHAQGVHELATQNAYYQNETVGTDGAPLNYQYFSEGVFNQNQLIVNGRVQTSKWLSLFGYYTLNSAHGDTSGGGSFLTTPHNIAADYGRTTFDVRNRLFLAGSIMLPKFIQVSPFLIAQSGNPFNVTTGFDNNGDSIFNDRPVYGAANGIAAGTTGSNTIAGCGSFVQAPVGTAYTAIPINACTGPALFTFNMRVTKTFGFGPSTVTPKSGGQGGPGGPGGGGPGGPPGGGNRGGGGGPNFGGGGSSTGKRYNVGVGVQVQNLFNNEDLATPIATLSSPLFGQSTQPANGPYTSSSALRRISVQASFNF